MKKQKFVLTARCEGQWRWRAIMSTSERSAINRAKVEAIELCNHDDPVVRKMWFRDAIVTLTDPKKKLIWSERVSALRKIDSAKNGPGTFHRWQRPSPNSTHASSMT